MMDDVRMTSMISKLAEVDPVFCEVVSKLYPGVDPRELWDLSKMDDQSEVHVNSAGRKRPMPSQPKQSNKGKKAIAAGIVLGSGAEALGTYRAGQAAFKNKKPDISTGKHVAAEAGPGQGELFHTPRGVKAGMRAFKEAHGSKAEFGLQAVNLGIGLAAARELFKNPKPKKQTIPKRAPITKQEFMDMCEPIIRARREGVITTDKALSMIEDVEKGLGAILFHESEGGIRGMKGLNRALKMHHEFTLPQQADQFREDMNHEIHTGRVALGTATAVGVGTAGYVHGKRQQKKKLEPETETVGKSEETVDYEFSGEISKMNDDKRQVFGWCSLSSVDGKPVVDLQNDYISIEEIEKSAYDYVKKSRKGGDMHARLGDEPVHTSDMIESMIVTPDKLRHMGVPDSAISKMNTGWWVGFQVNDEDQWRKVKNGERAGFSIHGKGARVEKMLDD